MYFTPARVRGGLLSVKGISFCSMLGAACYARRCGDLANVVLKYAAHSGSRAQGESGGYTRVAGPPHPMRPQRRVGPSRPLQRKTLALSYTTRSLPRRRRRRAPAISRAGSVARDRADAGPADAFTTTAASGPPVDTAVTAVAAVAAAAATTAAAAAAAASAAAPSLGVAAVEPGGVVAEVQRA